MNKIATLLILNSKPDIYGNCYFAFTWTDHEKGKTIEATISGGDSNIRWIVHEMGLDWQRVFCSAQEYKIREFNRLVKGWPYAGCTPKELANFIRNNLNKS